MDGRPLIEGTSPSAQSATQTQHARGVELPATIGMQEDQMDVEAKASPQQHLGKAPTGNEPIESLDVRMHQIEAPAPVDLTAPVEVDPSSGAPEQRISPARAPKQSAAPTSAVPHDTGLDSKPAAQARLAIKSKASRPVLRRTLPRASKLASSTLLPDNKLQLLPPDIPNGLI